MKTILVVGGAGYIGSHMLIKLKQEGCRVVVLDNLSTGYLENVNSFEFINGDLADKALLKKLFSDFDFDVVMHFASFISVGESVVNPKKYYLNNLVNTLNLLNIMIEFDVRNFIFSSTAAIFGEPKYIPIDEKHPTNPINPYGKTKLMVENILYDYRTAYGLHYVCLRYFNAAGAEPKVSIGENHIPETHLIPLVLQVASGRRKSLTIYGDDYDTKDGTCIRDYIHVCDLCDAHWLALQYLKEKKCGEAFNLGNGDGYSVKEVVDIANEVTGTKIAVNYGERRPGDSPILIANSKQAINVLGWKPRYSRLLDIIQHAWNWEQKLCKGDGCDEANI